MDWRNRDQLAPHWWVLRGACRVLRDADGWFSGLADRLLPRQYQITGGCLKRGVCCQRIGIGLTSSLFQSIHLKRWIRRWYEFVYHFEWIEDDPDATMLLFRCRYLTHSKCGIYADRPYICKRYPQARYFGRPTFLPGCGYRAKSTP